jgi:hypothetical protein
MPHQCLSLRPSTFFVSPHKKPKDSDRSKRAEILE